MKYLLDTHVLLWYIDGSSDLSEISKEIIQNPEFVKYVSIVSLWEIAIKINIGKLALTRLFETLPEYINANGFSLLPLVPEHLYRLTDLQLYHKDPFDRVLIAQAISNDMTVISADQHFTSYPVNVMW